MNNMASRRVAILMGTCNGDRHLSEQLDSFFSQTHGDCVVSVSDDGSTDGTRALLDRARSSWGADRLAVREGPGTGFSANFLSLVANPGVEASYYAFSDQDDVWEPVRLARAVEALEKMPSDRPALYCSRTRYIGPNGEPRRLSPAVRVEPGFRHALVQNIASGNTMVFNRACRDLVARTAGQVRVPFHDWWVYLLVTGAGGEVVWDPFPTVRYRQHGSNQLGENRSLGASLARAGGLFSGRFREWNEANGRALRVAAGELTEENRRLAALFERARTGSFPSRCGAFRRVGARRNTWLGNAGLWAGVAFNKL